MQRFRLEALEVGKKEDECARTDSDWDINIQASRLPPRLGVGNFLLHVSVVLGFDNPSRSKKTNADELESKKLCFINRAAAAMAVAAFLPSLSLYLLEQ